MPDIVIDGNVKVVWCTSIASIAAPTTAELNAGTALESFITPDGFDIKTDNAEVDTSSLASTQNSANIGRRSDAIMLTFKQQGKTAAPWTTFAGKPQGFLVVRRNGIASGTAWTSTQKVTVYTAQVGDRAELSPAANEMDKFQVKCVISGAVNDTAAVA